MPDSLSRETVAALREPSTRLLARYPAMKPGILFGSLAEGHATSASDLDLGVAAITSLDTAMKTTLMQA